MPNETQYSERLVLTTPPASPIVSTADMRAYLRVDTTADDALIAALVETATEHVQEYTGRQIINATYTWSAEYFFVIADPQGLIWLPKNPLVSITQVRQYDGGPDFHPMTAGEDYEIGYDGDRAFLRPINAWPDNNDFDAPDAVQIVFTAGHGTTAPAIYAQAVKMIVAALYENRGDDLETVNSLIGKGLPSHIGNILSALLINKRIQQLC